jgi:hypothetical protein
MARSPQPGLPRAGYVATYGSEAFHFFTPVGLGVLGALFGVVAVSGAALVIPTSGLADPKVESVAATTAQRVAEPDSQSDQSAPALPTNETPATDLPEATEPATSIEAESSTDLPEGTPTGAPENEAASGPGEDKGAENPLDEASEVPAANRQATVAKILPPFTLPREGSKREILLIDNVHADQLEEYQLKCFIVGVAHDYEFAELPKTDPGISSWVELDPNPVQNAIARITLTTRKVARRVVSRKVRITHGSENERYSFFEVHLNLHYRSSQKALLLVIQQALAYPAFSELNGLTVSSPEAYYFDKFDKTYSDDLVRWETTVSNGIMNLPREIQKHQSKINVLRNQINRTSGNGIRAINARRALASKVDALTGNITDLERRIINYRAVTPFLNDMTIWYAAAHDDIDYLVDHLRIDFDLEREDASGSPVTLVSTRGGN